MHIMSLLVEDIESVRSLKKRADDKEICSLCYKRCVLKLKTLCCSCVVVLFKMKPIRNILKTHACYY